MNIQKLMLGIFLVVLFPLYSIANVTNFKRVSIVIAEKKGLGQSSFGHAYLRLSEDDEWSDNDTIYEFIANNEGQPIDRAKGMGLTEESYNYTVHAQKYQDVRYEINIFEDRTLVSYPLKLSSEQIASVLTIINQKTIDLKQVKYNFFKRNCATQISDILDTVLSRSGGGLSSIVPTMLDGRYSDIIDISKIDRDESASISRRQLVQKHLPEYLSNNKTPVLTNIRTQLTSALFRDRMLAIIKLIKIEWLVPDFSKEDRKKMFIFLNRFALLEMPTVKSELLKIINLNSIEESDKKIRLIPLFKKYDEYSLGSAQNINANADSKLSVENDELIATFYYREQEGFENKNGIFKISLKKFGFEISNNQIRYGNSVIGHVANSKIFGDHILQSHFYLRAEEVIGKQWNYFLPYLLVESPNQNSFMNSYLKLEDSDIIPIRNFNYKGIGNCMTLSIAQKKLLEQVRFAPDLKALDQEKNYELFQKMMDGYFVIVPGFKTNSDWIEFIGTEKIKNYLGELSIKMNLTDLFSSALRFISGIKLDSENIKDLDISLSRGIPVAIRFSPNGKEQHEILVYEIKDIGSEYVLGFYDSNLGYFDASSTEDKFRYIINKKTGIIRNAVYSSTGSQAYVDSSQLEHSELFKEQQKRPDIQKFLNAAVTTGRFYFTLDTMRY